MLINILKGGIEENVWINDLDWINISSGHILIWN